MTALSYHLTLYRRSLALCALAVLVLGLCAWGIGFLGLSAFFQIPLGLIGVLAGRIFWFHAVEAWKLRWLIAVDRINANLFRNSRA